MAVNFWRRLRRVRVGRAERRIKQADVESATKLRCLGQDRKLLESRLEEARQDLAPLKTELAAKMIAKRAQLWFLLPLFIGGLFLAVLSNLWGLEPFAMLSWWKRPAFALSFPVISLIGGWAIGRALRMASNDPFRRVYFGIGFTVLFLALIGTFGINVVRGLDMARQEEQRRQAMNVGDDLDARDVEINQHSSSSREKLMTSFLTIISITIGVGGELASAFAFDQILLLFIPVFTEARLRRRVRRLEDRLNKIVVAEEETRSSPELERALIAIEAAEIIEIEQELPAQRADKESSSEKQPREYSLVQLAWRIAGAVLLVAIVVFLSVAFAFSGGRPEAQTVILLDLTTSVSSNAEFNRDRSAVEGIIKRIDDAGHRLSIFGIGDSSFGQPPLLASTTPAEIGRYREYLEGWKRGISAKWRKVSERLSPSANCTDLFGAIARAAIELEESPASKKQLVILSDMRQACRGYNFEKQLDDPHLLIKRVEREGLIPRLDSVGVWILGAHTAGINEKHWSKLKVFWTEYFKIAGAKLNGFSPNRRLGEQGGNQ